MLPIRDEQTNKRQTNNSANAWKLEAESRNCGSSTKLPIPLKARKPGSESVETFCTFITHVNPQHNFTSTDIFIAPIKLESGNAFEICVAQSKMKCVRAVDPQQSFLFHLKQEKTVFAKCQQIPKKRSKLQIYFIRTSTDSNYEFIDSIIYLR